MSRSIPSPAARPTATSELIAGLALVLIGGGAWLLSGASWGDLPFFGIILAVWVAPAHLVGVVIGRLGTAGLVRWLARFLSVFVIASVVVWSVTLVDGPRFPVGTTLLLGFTVAAASVLATLVGQVVCRILVAKG